MISLLWACAHPVVALPPKILVKKSCSKNRFCVVIDPGHGGLEIGTQSPQGILEKDVALSLSFQLETLLKKEGYDVFITRRADEDLSLDARAQMANRLRANLFISLHANSAPEPYVQGIETYFLSSDHNHLAQRENAHQKLPFVDLILVDLKNKALNLKSQRLATEIQTQLIKQAKRLKPQVKNHGVKSALFYVLLGVKMPSVLVETAFLSNPKEAEMMAAISYQKTLAIGLKDAIKNYRLKVEDAR